MRNIKITEKERATIFTEPVKCPIENQWCFVCQGNTRCDDCPLCVILKGEQS